MNDQPLLGAYLLYYWPVSYLQISLSLLSQPGLLASLGKREIVRVLDLGCGPGSASSALVDLLPKGCDVELTLVDYSAKAMKLAMGMIYRPNVRCVCVRKDLQEEGVEDLGGPYDIILLSHVLNELWKEDARQNEKRFSLAFSLGGKLTKEGVMLLCEPALLLTSRNLMEVRDLLVASGWQVAGPCMASSPCPALAAGVNHTCHQEVAWTPAEPMATLARMANLDRESVKMTYFFVGRNPLAQERKGPCIHALVVSDAMMNKSGRVRFLFCDGTNRYSVSAPKGDLHAKREGFFSLKRYDEVVLRSLEQRGGGFGFGPESLLELVPER